MRCENEIICMGIPVVRPKEWQHTKHCKKEQNFSKKFLHLVI